MSPALRLSICSACGLGLFACSGEGELRVPQSLGFGQVEAGSEGAERVLELKNVGDGAIQLTAIQLESETGEFELLEGGAATIEGGESYPVKLRYRPVDEGLDSGLLIISAGAQFEVQLTGSGVELGLEVAVQSPECGGTAGSISFDSVSVGATVARVFKLKSTGSGDLQIAAYLSDSEPVGFTVDPQALTLPAGTEAEIKVSFSPVRLGDVTAELVIEANTETIPVRKYPLCGAGTLADLCLSPPRVDLLDVPSGTTKSQTVEIESCGNLPVTVSTLATSNDLSHPTDPGFSVSPLAAPPITLQPGESTTVDVTFTAADLMPRTGFLHVASDASTPDIYLPLSANKAPPCDLTVVPGTVEFFGSGGPELRRVFVENDGSETCSIIDTRINSGPFQVVPTVPLPYDVDSGGAVVFVMEYNAGPQAAWPESGELEIEYSADGVTESVQIGLIGNPILGPGCHLDIRPAAASFGTVQVGEARDEASELWNVGTEVCAMANVIMDISSDASFQYLGTPSGVLIQPNDFGSLPVRFEPQLLGSFRGLLRGDSTDPAQSSFEIPLFGTAIRPPPVFCDNCTCPDGEVAVYRRYDNPYASSSLKSPMTESPFHALCEPGVVSCDENKVQVETEPGVFECADPPPECAPGDGLEYSSAGWECVTCDVIVQFGFIYDGKRVCTEDPNNSCGAGNVPTFVYETETWECSPLCDNSLYDQRTLPDGTLICIPC